MPPFIEKVLTYFKSISDLDKMGFLSSFFKTKEEDFTTAELVDIDIVRSGEMVAPALRPDSHKPEYGLPAQPFPDYLFHISSTWAKKMPGHAETRRIPAIPADFVV